MAKKLSEKIFIYAGIAYAVTWGIAFGIYFLFENGALNNYQLNLYHSLAAIGPAFAAFGATYFYYGKVGINKLISRIRLGVPDKRTTFFIVSPLLFFGIGLILYAIVNNDLYSFKDFAALNWTSSRELITWLLPLLTYAIFEEIGWRGFLLPHLQEKYNAWKATLILTIIWALWHIPFFFYRFDFSPVIAIGFFFGIFVGAIIMTSIYNSSRGFLIPAMLFHFMNNLCSEFDKEIVVAVLSTGYVFIAIYTYKYLGRENLSRRVRIKNFFIE